MNQTDTNTFDLVGMSMIREEVPPSFVLAALALAATSDGMRDLLHLWNEYPEPAERRDILADIGELLEDQGGGASESLVVRSQGDVERELARRRAFKERLRTLVERHGGVSKVARKAGMAQPSLRRLLNTMSEPRLPTLQRLAKALDTPVEHLLNPRSGVVIQLDDYRPNNRKRYKLRYGQLKEAP